MIWANGMARPSGSPNDFITGVYSSVSDRGARQTVDRRRRRCRRRGAVNCRPTAPYTHRRRRTTVSAIHNGSAFAARFSRSAIFLISECFGRRFGLLSKFFCTSGRTAGGTVYRVNTAYRCVHVYAPACTVAIWATPAATASSTTSTYNHKQPVRFLVTDRISERGNAIASVRLSV